MTILLEHNEICTCGDIHVNTSINNIDPTRTVTLRNAFSADMKRRFRALTRLIFKAVVTEDVFGLSDSPTLFQEGITPGRRAFAYMTSGEKVEAFMLWLREQVNNGILEISEFRQLGQAVQQEWTNLYIQDSYKRGLIRGHQELDKAGFPVSSLELTGGVAAIMSTPFHLDRVGLLYTRTYEGLKGITASMDSQISRVLAQGMADGDGPRLLARKLVGTINGTKMGDLGITDTLGRFIPAERRAIMLARTEIIRAHHVATIQQYRTWGVVDLKVKAEWTTAGDGRVCPTCASLEGKIYTLDQVEPMIPVHPNCRCMVLPLFID